MKSVKTKLMICTHNSTQKVSMNNKANLSMSK